MTEPRPLSTTQRPAKADAVRTDYWISRESTARAADETAPRECQIAKLIFEYGEAVDPQGYQVAALGPTIEKLIKIANIRNA